MLVAKKMKRSLSRIDISRPRLGLGLYIEVNVSRTAINFYWIGPVHGDKMC
jgi:hypothetical protein